MTHTTVARPPFHLELRSAVGTFLTDEPCESAEIAVRAFAAIADRSGPAVYGPHGTHRLVIPAGRRSLFEPDAAAWLASAERRRVEAAAEAAQEAYADAEDVSMAEALRVAGAVFDRELAHNGGGAR